jgi:transcriptional regulator with XRE-family HTH domain
MNKMIKLWRIKSGMSQEEAARALGMSQPNYSALERNGKNIKVEMLVRIFELFYVPVQEQMDYLDEMKRKV